MTRIRRLYDKDQEVIIYNPIIVPLQIFLLDWLESGNLEIGNMNPTTPRNITNQRRKIGNVTSPGSTPPIPLMYLLELVLCF